MVRILVCLLLLAACKPSVPEQYIQPDDMEDLLYDYHLSQGIASVDGHEDSYQKQLYFESVLKKHGVTRAEFDSSLVYYYNRADRFSEIYKKVQERLADQALTLGTSESEVERFTSLSQNGDTTDIWKDDNTVMLMANKPYDLYQFQLKADTSYHAGDSFLLTFNTSRLSDGNSRQAVVYLAITYQNDSTISQNTSITNMGSTMLRIAPFEERVKEIKGFIKLGVRPEQNDRNHLDLLFMNRIRLIRFHKTEDTPAPQKPSTDSLQTVKADSVANDSTKPHIHRLGERPQRHINKENRPTTIVR